MTATPALAMNAESRAASLKMDTLASPDAPDNDVPDVPDVPDTARVITDDCPRAIARESSAASRACALMDSTIASESA